MPHPQKIKIDAIKVIIIRALHEQGVREALPEWQRRHEFKGAHGFRKFFKTHAEQFMNHSNVELLLGHSADALQASYYKPTESDVLNDYLKAVDILTIDYDKNTLTKQVAELKEKSKEDSYIIKGKLAEKEKEAEETRKALADVEDRQKQFEEKILNNLERYQKTMLEMVGPYLEQTVKDKRELNRAKIETLIQAPSAFDLIKEEYLENQVENEEEEEYS